jgi:hypothetical protein
MRNDFVAGPRRAIAEDDDFVVHQFDTGRGAGPCRPQIEIAADRLITERRPLDLAQSSGDTNRRGAARQTH